MRLGRWGLLSLALVLPADAIAQNPLGFVHDGHGVSHLYLAADHNDDDDDGATDGGQERPPFEDTIRMRLAGSGRAELRVLGPMRVIWAGAPITRPAEIHLPAEIRLQGTAAGPAQLRLVQGELESVLAVDVVQIDFVDADGDSLDGRRDALAPSLSPENANAIATASDTCVDDRAFYVRLSGLPDGDVRLALFSEDSASVRARNLMFVHIQNGIGRTPWLRIVTDAHDATRLSRSRQLLRARLRDHVVAAWGEARQSLRVGRPGVEEGPLAARQIKLRIVTLAFDGRPVIGSSPLGAERLAAQQAESVAAAWSQCLIDVDSQFVLRAPPPPALLAIADGNGLPAAGGTIHFRANDREVTIVVDPGLSALQVAQLVSDHLEQQGFAAVIQQVPRALGGAFDSADIIVRDAEGFLATLRPITREQAAQPLTTDRRQTVRIGRVDLANGLMPFANSDTAGTLEERTLVSLLRDDDERTVDLFIINHFTGRARRGEAFVPSDRGPLSGTVIIDRDGVARSALSWTAAHEVGHVLLDNAFHPDDFISPAEFGRSLGRRLMVSGRRGGSRGLSPRRLTAQECARARERGQYPPGYLVQHPN